MTNQEINERVAKLCGWVASVETIEHNIGYQWTENRTCWSFPGRGRHLRPPNYAESLDVCRGFSDKMSNDDHLRFQEELVCILPVGTYSFDEMGHDRRLVIDATPLQRCEAFLRLKEQWDED